MKKIAGIIIAGIVILALIGNGKNSGTKGNKEAGNGTGTTVTAEQGSESQKESSDGKQAAVKEDQTPDEEAEAEPPEEMEEPEEDSLEEPEEDSPEGLEKPEEEQEAEEEPEKEQENEPEEEPEDIQEESSEDGISPEFKTAMDSYEEFFDEYIAFMDRYSHSDNPSGMIMDYSAYMMKYADTMKKLEEIDTEKMTVQEQTYYIEVMARIQKKLLESTQ